MSQGNNYGIPPQNMPSNYSNYVGTIPSQQNMGYPQSGYSNQSSPLYRPISAPSYPIIVGKMVNQLNDIRPNEVPNDGSVAVFPQSDLSCVYIKYLKADGLIATARYVLDTSVEKTQSSPDEMEEIHSKLNEIVSMLKGQNRSYRSNKKYSKNGYKEVKENVQEQK